MRTGQLLLVEDDQDNREMLALILGERYSVSSCGSAAEAVTALDALRPDLLVLDIGMKPVDGLKCLKAIRARPGYATVPAIALTGHAREVDRQAFLAGGFQAVVTKPIVDFQELDALIASLLKPACFLAATSSDTPGDIPRNGHSVSRGILTGAPNGRMIFDRGGSTA
jgi:CheY-like chemotaxis protein